MDISSNLPRLKTTLQYEILDKSRHLLDQSPSPLQGRKTKIICTIGPATKPVEILCKMLESGMNIARLNFSHGTHQYHRETIANIREASAKTQIPCAVLLDTKGPEIRTGMLQDGNPIILEKGSTIRIHCGPPESFLGTTTDISVDHKEMTSVLSIGSVIKIDDGLLNIRVTEIKDSIVHGQVLNTQELGQKKGVNLPGIDTGLPALTEKDKKDILFGVEEKVDIIAASFINAGQDVVDIRKVLGESGAYIKIISKIESVQGLKNFDDILKESDGIMVARGDLGVEIPIQKVCMAQKTMISKCNSMGKPIATATQMLDSMIKNPIPTRAEVADVANAVFDGTDCVMLSGESAKGKYPVESVSIMAKICRRSEMSIDYSSVFSRISLISSRAQYAVDLRTESVTCAAVKIAMDLQAKIIFALTDSGRTAGYVSKYAPSVPILCVTPSKVTARQSLIRKGLYPIIVEESLDDEQRYRKAVQVALEEKWCQPGDCGVMISGKQGISGSSYQLKVVTIE